MFVAPAPGTLGSGRRGLADLLARHPGIDAVFCSSDMLALGAVIEAQSRGISVPEGLAEMLRRPGTNPDPLRRAGSELVLLTSPALRLMPLAGQLPFVDHGMLDAAAGPEGTR